MRRAAAAAPGRCGRPHGGVPGAAVNTIATGISGRAAGSPGHDERQGDLAGHAARSPLLTVEGLSKRFPVRGARRWLHAVDDVSFTIERGECVGLVGESGCGKSTLVRLLTRLIDPTAGRVVFDGRDIGALPARGFARDRERARIQM